MRKHIAVIIALVMAFSLCGCGSSKSLFPENTGNKQQTKTADSGSIKVGYLLSSDGDAPDTVARVQGIRKMQEETGIADDQIIIAESVKKADCEKKAAELVEKGCDIIFAENPNLESILEEAAKKYPDVQFCQESGKLAKKSGLSNFHNYDTRIYEAYHVAGLVAGVKLNHLLDKGDISASECVIGFVAYDKTAKTTSCINAFYLGVERVCSQSSILVRYVGKRGAYDADGKAARQLIAAGVKMMAQYTYTTAVATVCAENDTPLIGNDVNLISTAPKDALTSVTSDWSKYYTYAVNKVLNGKEIAADWTAGYAEDAVVISQLNDEHVTDGTAAKAAELEKNLRAGNAKVFNTEKFTIDGSSLDTLATSNTNFKKYKKYIKNGNLQESMTQSKSIFDTFIDGITESTQDYLAEQSADSAESTTQSN